MLNLGPNRGDHFVEVVCDLSLGLRLHLLFPHLQLLCQRLDLLLSLLACHGFLLFNHFISFLGRFSTNFFMFDLSEPVQLWHLFGKILRVKGDSLRQGSMESEHRESAKE